MESTVTCKLTIIFVFCISEKKAKDKSSKSGKNKLKSKTQSALTSLNEDTDRRNNLIGSKQFGCFSHVFKSIKYSMYKEPRLS